MKFDDDDGTLYVYIYNVSFVLLIFTGIFFIEVLLSACVYLCTSVKEATDVYVFDRCALSRLMQFIARTHSHTHAWMSHRLYINIVYGPQIEPLICFFAFEALYHLSFHFRPIHTYAAWLDLAVSSAMHYTLSYVEEEKMNTVHKCLLYNDVYVYLCICVFCGEEFHSACFVCSSVSLSLLLSDDSVWVCLLAKLEHWDKNVNAILRASEFNTQIVCKCVSLCLCA